MMMLINGTKCGIKNLNAMSTQVRSTSDAHTIKPSKYDEQYE